jgi:predicted component of type VI protein secretion system
VVSPFSLTDSGFKAVSVPEDEGQTSITVVPIRKTPGANRLKSLIAVGRAGANDIQLKSKSVSKFHAHLEFDDQGDLQIIDSFSTYGTHLNGRKLKPNEKARLRSGDQLRLGGLNLSYHTPEALYALLSEASPSAV